MGFGYFIPEPQTLQLFNKSLIHLVQVFSTNIGQNKLTVSTWLVDVWDKHLIPIYEINHMVQLNGVGSPYQE